MKKMIIVTVVLAALLMAVLNCGAESDGSDYLYSESFARAEAKYGISSWKSDKLNGLFAETGGLGYWDPGTRTVSASWGKWLGSFIKNWVERHKEDLKKMAVEFGLDFVKAILYKYCPGVSGRGTSLSGFISSSAGNQIIALIYTD